MSGFVYLWENKVTGKKYLGSHVGNINDGYLGSGVAFRKAVKKYGIENFERTILEFVDCDKEVRIKEQQWLDFYNAAGNLDFYNLSPQATGGWDYVNSNPEFKKKSVEANKDLWSKKPHPRGMLGKHHTNENWQKTRTGWKTWADKNLKKQVLQFDLEMNLVREHESITEAAKSVKGSASNIKYTIEGRFSKAYGYKWKYKEQ